MKLQGWVGHMENWQWHCSAVALNSFVFMRKHSAFWTLEWKHRCPAPTMVNTEKRIHSFASDILHVWENLLSALSILWSKRKDWLTDAQWTSCEGVLCQAFHQGYETIGVENEMQNNVLLHFPWVLHTLVYSTAQKGLTSLYDIPPAVQYGKNPLGKQQKKPLALRAIQLFRNTRFRLSSANHWGWTSVNGQD